MTEKRADYRKKQQKKKINKIFNFKKNQKEDVPTSVEEPLNSNESLSRESLKNASLEEERESKVNRLKKRLNYAILIVVVLLVIVLFALFKL